MELYSNCGICIGATTVSFVSLNTIGISPQIIYKTSFPHNGNPKISVEQFLKSNEINKITSTGRNFKGLLNIDSISEAQAIEYALEYLKIDVDLVVSAGAENFIIYLIDKKRKINKVITGNKCASGTGEFFVQQLKRMDIKLSELDNYSENESPYNISGRCSVFCKSDCTHALNKGIPKQEIVSGLSKMMADKIINLIPRYKNKNILLVGGTVKNLGFINHLKSSLTNLQISEHSTYFEALGAACYSYYNNVSSLDYDKLFLNYKTTFTFHKPLKDFINKVRFEKIDFMKAQNEDECIIGLDVGSTTTKAIILRTKDNAILAGEYLRTNGNPLIASKECYKKLFEQLENTKINIIGLGVTGSGREIAGLHAQTNSIINEIIAHAAATLHFDNKTDTIFEIGGQDAKYTYITNGVASDYAMNEACSAGTGSFLEEAAGETLNVDFRDIASLALEAENPPNFNDQCSAFIGSDIKNALHQGILTNDVLAGLVYSICLNYINRVLGNRPIGNKIFMQGGVCYNKAVPVAMAALTGKEIIVPPYPGLMGAYGVALELKKRIAEGVEDRKVFDLSELIEREINFKKSFVCAGGKEKCDRKCQISLFEISGKLYPFGGACNLYNIVKTKDSNNTALDYVKLRQDLVFNKYIEQKENKNKTIGILKSFMTNTYYPLFYNFFAQMGFNVVLESDLDKEGIEKINSSFCYPAELSHGFMQSMIKKKPNYIFIPHIREFEKEEKDDIEQKACVLVQAESYYLKTAFKLDLHGIEILNPVIDFAELGKNENSLIDIAVKLGINKKFAQTSLSFALEKQKRMFDEFKELGKKALSELKSKPDNIAIVLLGRAYNSFTDEANLGIPKKFTGRNVTVIPLDFLDTDDLDSKGHMYWRQGSLILKSAKIIKDNPQLFGVYITNFSCGPDSFLLSYFRDIMGNKPSLTLELDSHTADAGINTRIEAAIEIFKRNTQKSSSHVKKSLELEFSPFQVTKNNEVYNPVTKERYSLYNKKVKVILPNMGFLSTQVMQSTLTYFGINSEVLPIYDTEILRLGRSNTLCKECLPLQLCAGSLVDYTNKRIDPDEITLYFMSAGNGPCRLGQYSVFLERTITKQKIKNAGVLTLTDEDGYSGFGTDFYLRGWIAFTSADVMRNIYNALLVLAYNKKEALSIFNNEWEKILKAIANDPLENIYDQLEKTAEALNKIEKKYGIKHAKKVSLVGEIFVRNEEFSRVDLIERLAEKEFVVTVAPISEYIYYSDYLEKTKAKKINVKDFLFGKIKSFEQKRVEKKIKNILCKSDLVEYSLIEVEKIIDTASEYLPKELEGEAILTIGSALNEILNHSSGIISIAPFGCMPGRIAESILNTEMTFENKLKSEKRIDYVNEKFTNLPFLAIETDGNVYPQIIQSKIEIFMLNAERVHFEMKKVDDKSYFDYTKALLKYLLSFYSKKDTDKGLNEGFVVE